MSRSKYILLLLLLTIPLLLSAAVPPKVERSADSLARLCAEPLYNYNFESAQALLKDTLKKNPYIRVLTITDTLTNKEFLHVAQPTFKTEETQTLTRQIHYDGKQIGTLQIQYTAILPNLTHAERAWIRAHKELRVGILEWEPISMIKEGKASGIVGDYLKLISERTGITFKALPAKQWPDLLEKFKQRQIDLIPSIERDDITVKLGEGSEVYMRFPYVVVSRIKESFIDSMRTLEGKKIALPEYAHSYRYLQIHYPKITLIPTKDTIEALELVKENKAFAFIGHMAVAMHYVGNFYANTLHIAGKTDLVYKHTMLVHHSDKILVSILNKALSSITRQEQAQIKNRWLHIEVKEAADYTLFYTIGAVFLLLILASLYWNRKLSQEIQERKMVEKALDKAKQEAERANNAKSAFLANMSHEIRTPMNAIAGFTELLAEEVERPRLRSYVNSIQNASHTLLRLINDILDLSKIEAGKLTMEYTPTNLRKLCTEIISVFELTIKKKGLTLQMNIDPELPECLLLDEIRLRQILLNLIGNAVKFTESGYVKLNIHTSVSKACQECVDIAISIEDSGIGIPQDQITGIFEAFVQTEGQDNRKYGGTGLGLPISKRLSEMMGGSIIARSTPGEGSVFTLYLPNIKVSDSTTVPTHIKLIKLEQFSKALILIVDDVQDNRELIVKVFEKSQIDTITANDGEEAVKMFKRHRPDLVLMDIRMPRMDGYKATRIIKSLSPDTPVIALTASVVQEDSKASYFDGFLGKPVSKKALLSVLADHLPYSEQAETSTHSHEAPLWEAHLMDDLEKIPPAERHTLITRYSKALQSNSISDIETFTMLLKQLRDTYNISLFEHYITQMEAALDAFDIAHMEQLLKAFESVREHLRTLV